VLVRKILIKVKLLVYFVYLGMSLIVHFVILI
jgi:hypothetical protein